MQEKNENVIGKKDIYKAVILGLSLPLLLYIIYSSPMKNWLNPDHMDKLKQELKYWYIVVPLLFWFVGTLCIGFGMPRMFISIFAGGIFGLWFGVIIMEITCLTGALIMFFYARWTRKTFLSKMWKKQIPVMDEYMQKHGFLTTLLLRQIPLPGVVLNILMGLSCVKISLFILASAIGFLPQNIIFTLMGSGLKENFLSRTLISSSGLIAFSILLYFLYHKIDMVKNLFQKMQPTSHDAG